MAQRRNPRVDLIGGQLAALPWFRALCHLDLEVLGHGQVETGDTEASRGNLLDLAATQGVTQALG